MENVTYKIMRRLSCKDVALIRNSVNFVLILFAGQNISQNYIYDLLTYTTVQLQKYSLFLVEVTDSTWKHLMRSACTAECSSSSGSGLKCTIISSRIVSISAPCLHNAPINTEGKLETK